MLLEDNFSYVAENVAVSRLTDVQEVFYCLFHYAGGDIGTSHKKRHYLTVSLAFCFSEMSDKTAA